MVLIRGKDKVLPITNNAMRRLFRLYNELIKELLIV